MGLSLLSCRIGSPYCFFWFDFCFPYYALPRRPAHFCAAFAAPGHAREGMGQDAATIKLRQGSDLKKTRMRARMWAKPWLTPSTQSIP